jgi:hypothetical protein
VWGTAYQFIGQCLLFQQELNKLTANYVSDAERTQWLAESKFLIAYYHFTLLRRYGPIPLTDTYVPQDTPTSAYNGRFHFDYCVKWISDMLDEAAKLPATRSTNEWSRATSTICKAVKHVCCSMPPARCGRHVSLTYRQNRTSSHRLRQ